MKQEQEIFERAMALPFGEVREGFLRGACGANRELRRNVDELLAAIADAREMNFLTAGDREQKTQSVPADAQLERDPGTFIGRYKLLQKIGEGGMGVVYMAEQEEPVRRKVALKIIKLGMDTKSVIARFESERQALAMMDHLNIARVLDGGATDAGRPYFVMELVRGFKITEYCDEARLSTRDRLDLFIQVCQAIQHAHQKGIIHRDIKPTNILVTINDGVAVPKVIDFGIAKATEGRLTNKTLFTQFEALIGTPAYMSPEQAVMTSLDIDTRSDIYSLGVLLYELLTGSTPFEVKELMSSGFDAMRKTIREKEPARPSTLLASLAGEEQTTMAKRRSAEPSKLVNLLKGDLDWIVMKCLEKDRARRYETANGLAADLKRHLNNEPVVARPPSATYRFQKTLRRNKLVFTATAAIATVLVLGLIVSAWQAVRATQAEREQGRLRSEAVQERNKALAARVRADQATSLARQRAAELTRNLYFAEMNLAGQAAADPAGISRIAELTDKWLPKAGESDQRGWEWRYLRSLTRLDLFTFRAHSNAVQSVSWSPDGKRLASAGEDQTIKIWDEAGGQVSHTLRGHTRGVTSVSWSPDGQRLASASKDETLKIWDADSGQEKVTLRGHIKGVQSVSWSPDGKHLASASDDFTLKVWDAESGQLIHTLRGHDDRVYSVAWSPDGKRLASASDDYTIVVWDAHNGQALRTLRGHTICVESVAWSPDGRRLASASEDNTVKIWDAESGEVILTLNGHTGYAQAVAWSPDGKRLASASQDHTLKVWEVNSGQLLRNLRGHTFWVNSVAWSPDGKRLASASEDNTVKVWDAASEDTLTLRGHAGYVHSVAWSPDGKRLASGSFDNTVKIWESDDGQEHLNLREHLGFVLAVSWGPDGKHLVSASRDNTLKIWEANTGQLIHTLRGHRGGLFTAAWSPDSKRLASGGSDGLIKLWDSASGQVITNLVGHHSTVNCVAWSPDGQRLASGSGDRSVIVWDAASGQVVTNLISHYSTVNCVAWSPDGKRIASGSSDNTVIVWDASGGPTLTLRGHTGALGSVSWSPDGKTMASGSADNTVKIWDGTSGQETLTLHGHAAGVASVSWSPDGRRLASGSWDHTVKIWDARKGYALEGE